MPDEPRTPTLGGYIETVKRWRATAAAVVLVVLIATLIFTLTADKIYTAGATLIPESPGPETAGLTSMLLNNFGGFLPGMTTGPATAGDIVVSLLESKSLAGSVVDTLDLAEAWEIDEGDAYRSREVAIDKLKKNLRIVQDERTLVKLRVQDTDPVRAAAIANAFLDELDQANQEFSTSSAGRTRRFVEQRLTDTEDALAEAQRALEEFQREHGALAIDEQTKTTVEVVAKLQGEIEALKAKRDALAYSLSNTSAEVGTIKAQIAALEARVRSLMAPGGDDAGEDTGVLLALGDVPGLAAEYARLLLAVKTQTTVYGMLAQQYEQAKIEEARNTPTVRILDRATPPLYRTRPRNKLNMAVGLVLGLALAFLAVLALDRLAPQPGTEKERWRELTRRPPFSGAA